MNIKYIHAQFMNIFMNIYELLNGYILMVYKHAHLQ